MTESEFGNQMGRLERQFGKFGDERGRILWRELQDLPAQWFGKVIDKFIGDCRQTPLLPEFREEIAIERERLWKIEKRQHAQEAKQFFRSSYGPEDVGTICKTIVKRMQGQVSDEDYANFQKMLNNVAGSNPDKNSKTDCKQCDDSGLIFHRDQDNYEWVYRCKCNAGMRQPQIYPIYQHQERTHKIG